MIDRFRRLAARRRHWAIYWLLNAIVAAGLLAFALR